MTCPLDQAREPVVHGAWPPVGDVIEIDALRLRCVLGISDEERRDRQDVIISLRIGTNARPAVAADCGGAVWNYRTATKSIISHVESSAYLTVEKLASEIARIVVVDHGAPWVRVWVHKPGALRFADSAGVVIYRCLHDFPDVPQASMGTVVNGGVSD